MALQKPEFTQADTRAHGQPYDGERIRHYSPTELDALIDLQTQHLAIKISDNNWRRARVCQSVIIRCLQLKRSRGHNVRAELLTAHARARMIGPKADGQPNTPVALHPGPTPGAPLGPPKPAPQTRKATKKKKRS